MEIDITKIVLVSTTIKDGKALTIVVTKDKPDIHCTSVLFNHEEGTAKIIV